MFVSFFVGCLDCETATLMGTEDVPTQEMAQGFIDNFAQLLNEEVDNPHCYIGIALPLGVNITPSPEGEPMNDHQMVATIAATAELKANIEASTDPNMFGMSGPEARRYILANAITKADYFIENAAWPVA